MNSKAGKSLYGNKSHWFGISSNLWYNIIIKYSLEQLTLNL